MTDLTRSEIEQIRACLDDGTYTPTERKDFTTLCNMALRAEAGVMPLSLQMHPDVAKLVHEISERRGARMTIKEQNILLGFCVLHAAQVTLRAAEVAAISDTAVWKIYMDAYGEEHEKHYLGNQEYADDADAKASLAGAHACYQAALSPAPDEAVKAKRIEQAYCAANDYINAMLHPSVLPESLKKIADAYWQAVREVS